MTWTQSVGFFTEWAPFLKEGVPERAYRASAAQTTLRWWPVRLSMRGRYSSRAQSDTSDDAIGTLVAARLERQAIWSELIRLVWWSCWTRRCCTVSSAHRM
jgi:hypothetical protein